MALPYPVLHGLNDAERNFDALLKLFPTEATSLPSQPFDGQTIDYVADAVNGVVWRFRYNVSSASAYKWEFVGGSSLRTATAGNMTNANATFTALTGGPSITTPLAGEWDVMASITMIPSSLSAGQTVVYVDAVATGIVLSAAEGWNSPSGFGRPVPLTAGQVLSLRCANANSVSTQYVNGRLDLRPVRVG